MPDVPHRYVSPEEDSGRWADFPFRDGDIVISTRSKSGTTWLQMICALLIFRTPDLPAPLGELSPWLDHMVTPLEDVIGRLVAQRHRRFIKTHTPLDGIPIDPRATYVVVGRHPLDMAVSLYHQGDNIDRARLRELTGAPEPTAPPAPRPPLHDWLVRWIGSHADPRDELDSLPGVMWHLSDAWRRRLQPHVVLVHYADLTADLDGTMRRLAEQLGISIDEDHWPDLVRAATFDAMKGNAGELVPNRDGVLADPVAFFRAGRSGEGRQLLSDAELAAYDARTAELAPADLLAWLHR
ncbi:MAG TPA: sulfotransferase domain-containing protein [Streptosporangiales bacterium]